jgi:hypothetical protein
MGCLSDVKKHHPHLLPPLEGEGMHHHQLIPNYRRIGQTSLPPPAEPAAYLSEVNAHCHGLADGGDRLGIVLRTPTHRPMGPPMAQAPKPTRVMFMRVRPNGRVCGSKSLSLLSASVVILRLLEK